MSSYFDYVRLRNFLREQGAAFAGLSEYAAPRQAARGRSLFADGRLRLALLTERCHFYYRARMRGVRVRARRVSQGFWCSRLSTGRRPRLALLTQRCCFCCRSHMRGIRVPRAASAWGCTACPLGGLVCWYADGIAHSSFAMAYGRETRHPGAQGFSVPAAGPPTVQLVSGDASWLLLVPRTKCAPRAAMLCPTWLPVQSINLTFKRQGDPVPHLAARGRRTCWCTSCRTTRTSTPSW